MKKTVSLFTLIVCIVFLLCCCTPAPIEPDDPDTEPDELSEEPVWELPEPALRTSSLSYEEYFSVERPISTQGPFDDGMFIIHPLNENLYYFRFNVSTTEEMYQFLTDAIRPVELLWNVYNLYVIEDDHQRIIELSYDADEQSVIYESEGRIDRLQVYEDVLFFRENSSICRLYIPTGDVDVLLTSEYLLDKQYDVEKWTPSISPISTTDFLWSIPDPNWHNNGPSYGGGILAASSSFFYSDLTKKSYECDRNIDSMVVGNEDFRNQYLIARGRDLLRMGMDPYTISYRTPDDDPHNKT